MFWKWFKMLFVDRPLTSKETNEIIKKSIELYKILKAKIPFEITDDMSVDEISAYIDQIKEHDREYQEDLRNEIMAIKFW